MQKIVRPPGRPVGSKTRPLEERQAEIGDMDGNMADKIRDAFEASPNALWRARCYKVVEGKEFGLFDFRPEESVDVFPRAQKEWGAGDYRVVVWKDSKINQNHNFSVMVPANWKPPAAIEEKPAMAVGDPMVLALLARMDEDRKVTHALLDRLTQQQTSAQTVLPPDPFTMTEKLLGLVTTITAATRASAGEGGTDLIMKGVELVSKIREAGGEGGGEGSNMVDLIRDAFKMAPAIIESVTAAQAAQAAPPQMKGEARVVRPVVAPAQPDPYKAQIAFLIERAASNPPGDPETWARAMFETVPLPMIEAILSQSDPVGFMAVIDGRVTAHKDWFLDLVDILQEIAENAAAPPGKGDDEPVDGADNPPASPVADTG